MGRRTTFASLINSLCTSRFPIYLYHGEETDIYGLPIHGNSGTKIGIDVGGPPVTPETRTFDPDPVREQVCVDFLNKLIPKVKSLLFAGHTQPLSLHAGASFLSAKCDTA